ncbi:hypothetical protein BJ165DRAFT_1350186 [Panaeolus papilionaceus]|nr:hypothetical protein BJ165DRAFT_1350186 [Panaeolus papilionaceus]
MATLGLEPSSLLHQNTYVSQYNPHASERGIARTPYRGEDFPSQKSWLLDGREHIIHTVHLSSPNRPDGGSTIAFLIDPTLIPLLPSPLPLAVEPYDGEPNFVVRQSPRIDVNTMENEEIGFGIYATRFIPAGTLIVRGHPALVAPTGKFPNEAYEEMANALPKNWRTETLSMANCYRVKNPKDESDVMTEVEGIIRTNAFALDLKTPPMDQGKRSRSGEEQKILSKEIYGGIHPVINRANHSCGPNAAIKWDQETLSMSLYALRDIHVDEEVLHSYADCTHSREKRMQKLFNCYKFSCDCPWCDVRVEEGEDALTREEKIKASDVLRDALGSWIFMHPTYKKWSDDLCAPDDLVIKSHQEALSLLGEESMYDMQLFLVEEIALCYAMLGDIAEFKKWGELTVQLSQVENKETYKKFSSWLEDPPRRMSRWGWRKKQREQKSRKGRRSFECDEDTGMGQDSMRFLFQFEDDSD